MRHDPLEYAKFERERRFLAPAAALAGVSAAFTRFEDLYITGTRLRQQQPDPRVRRLTTIYVGEAEQRVLAALALADPLAVLAHARALLARGGGAESGAS
ncbi:MAG TPA: hypothetical protein VII78_08615 [Myxococcota bacterium]|jgi:hypothetical protein